MATANILSIKNQGLVAYDGSATFNGRTLSATSSKISISNGNGVSGNPSVDVVEANLTLNNIGGTLGVSKGGTGANTLTNNSLLLGNGTSAVSGLGAATNGQIPIGSTGNAPVLATITAGSGVTITNGAGSIQIDSVGSAANAGAVLDMADDFLTIPTSGSVWSNYYWETQGSFLVQTTDLARPGVIRNPSGNCGIMLGNPSVGLIEIGGGQLTLQWYVKIGTLSDVTNRYNFAIGFINRVSGSPQAGMYFQYNDSVNSGNWQIINNIGDGSPTINNTNTAADTNWHVYKIIVNAAATSVAYYIDGTQVANSPITTDIPTAIDLSPAISVISTAGTVQASTLQVDLCTLQQVLTTPR